MQTTVGKMNRFASIYSNRWVKYLPMTSRLTNLYSSTAEVKNDKKQNGSAHVLKSMAKTIAKSVILQADINQKGKHNAVKVNYLYFLAENRLIFRC
jgi:hypothetical protein